MNENQQIFIGGLILEVIAVYLYLFQPHEWNMGINIGLAFGGGLCCILIAFDKRKKVKKE